MMKIEHIAIKTADIDRLRRFYCTHFGMEAEAEITGSTGNRIVFLHPAAAATETGTEAGAETSTGASTAAETRTGTAAATAPHTGTRIELMQHPGTPYGCVGGYAHMAFSAGGEDAVSALVSRLQASGAAILRQPLRTPSGTLLAAVADPDGNTVEIVP